MAKKDPAIACKEAFGERLRACRIKAGYRTYTEFAELINVQPEAYRLYEVGQSDPKLFVLGKISRLLDVSLDYLILGEAE